MHIVLKIIKNVAFEFAKLNAASYLIFKYSGCVLFTKWRKIASRFAQIWQTRIGRKKCAKTDAISSVSKLPRLKTRFSTLFLSSVGKPS